MSSSFGSSKSSSSVSEEPCDPCDCDDTCLEQYGIQVEVIIANDDTKWTTSGFAGSNGAGDSPRFDSVNCYSTGGETSSESSTNPTYITRSDGWTTTQGIFVFPLSSLELCSGIIDPKSVTYGAFNSYRYSNAVDAPIAGREYDMGCDYLGAQVTLTLFNNLNQNNAEQPHDFSITITDIPVDDGGAGGSAGLVGVFDCDHPETIGTTYEVSYPITITQDVNEGAFANTKEDPAVSIGVTLKMRLVRI